MRHLLSLLAAVALLVWGAHLVRTGVLRVFGTGLRRFLQQHLANRWSAALAGVGVTALVQSSTATALMSASFVGQGLITLPAALAVMRGADVGTALVALLFSADLSWLSPLCILLGVLLSSGLPARQAGRFGRVLIGLGLMLLALEGVVHATAALFQSPVLRQLVGAMDGDLLLQITLGTALAVAAYSSLAVVLLVAALVAAGAVPLAVAVGLVLGANLGSGVLAVLTTAGAAVAQRQVMLGNLLFKAGGVAVAGACAGPVLALLPQAPAQAAHAVVLYHLGFNLVASLLSLGFTAPVARLAQRLLPLPVPSPAAARPDHLDPSALATPALAIANAARQVLHQADVVESMLIGLLDVIRTNDLRLAEQLRGMDDQVDALHASIKDYLTRISRSALDDDESRRWTDTISFTINLEQMGDIIERAILDVEDKKIRPQRSFSDAGLAEIVELHGRLLRNLRLGMGVFLNPSVPDAQRLLDEKARFGTLQRSYADTHLARLRARTLPSLETSALHIDLISDLRRINSHICSIAYPVLQARA